jgi:transcriptional regulator with XRE-family HTH domain/tetratricopeptide (TPR) repeat protein
MSRPEARGAERVQTIALGTMLRRRREAHGLTQEDLAEKAGGHFTARTISNIERGLNRPQQHTLQDLMDALELAEAERIAVLAAWRALARRAGAPVHLGAPQSTAHTPLIGRASELALLERHLTGDGPPLLLLVGEPGIGKTRLLEEAVRLGHAAQFTVLEGGCQRHSGHDPYSPVLEALAGYMGRQAPSRLPALLQGCSWIVRLLPELMERMRLPLPLGTLPPEQERRLMFGAVRRFLVNAAGPRGTLLILDDVQWAGRDALDVLAALLAGTGEQPLRVLVAYRDTEVRPDDPLSLLIADLAHRNAVVRIPLGPLAPHEAEQLLDAWLPDAVDLGSAERHRILDRAEGVPFFLISSVQSLQLPAPRVGDVPWNLRQVVGQRVAGLPASAREVLEAAAIIGRTAPRTLLCAVAVCAEPTLLDALTTLCAAGLLEEQGAHEYRFAHDVIREVVDADLPSGRRAMLHRRVGEVLEEQAGNPAIELLAYHFSRAGDDDRAARYLEQAGDQAQERCALDAAQDHYQEAANRFDQLGLPLDAARAHHKLGLALRLEGRRYDEAVAALETAARTYEAAGDLESLACTAAEIGYTHHGRGTTDEGIQRLEEIRDRIEAHSVVETRRPGLAMLYAALAQLYLYAWLYPEHIAAVERTVALAREAGDDGILAVAELNQGMALLMIGRVAEGAAMLEQGRQLAVAVGRLAALVTTLSNVAAICLLAAEPEMALAYADQALVAAERVGDTGPLAFIHFLRGDALYYMGPWPQARDAFERGAVLGNQMEATATACYPLLGLGILALAQGELDTAWGYLEDGLRRAHDAMDARAVQYLAGALAECDLLSGRAAEALARLSPLLGAADRDGTSAFVLARLAWARMELGDLESGAESVEQAIAGARAARSPAHLSEALWVQTRIELRRGQWAAAESAVAEALALAQSKRYAIGELRALQTYAELHIQRGDFQAGRARLEEARALCRRLDASAEIARLEQVMAALPL